MIEMTFRIISLQNKIDPGFIENLENFIECHGYQITQEKPVSITTRTKTASSRISHEEFIRQSAEISRRIGLQPHDSADLIREDRDNR